MRGREADAAPTRSTCVTLSRIVKAYDVRGVVPDEIDPPLAARLGRATARVLGGPELVVGWDMRPSSPELAGAFMAGVREAGVGTVAVGLASTDLLYYASGVLGLPGAMWTASHNPAEYNGVKLCRAGAEPVSLDTGLAEIRDSAEQDAEPTGEPAGHRRVDLLHRYAAHVAGFCDADRMRPVRVAVDAGNGMAGLVAPAIFQRLPAMVEPLYFELDGTFPNHPANPIDEANLRDLQRTVIDAGAALGLAFDGDADRVFCVDERGEAVPPSLVVAVIADRVLAQHPGATVLHNLICSRVVPETVEAAGGTAVRTRVGHSYIKATMRETGAVFAGEHSGHYYFRDNFRADSGLIAAVVLLEALGEHGGTMSELVGPYDRYAASGEINVEVDDQQEAIERVAEALADHGEVERLDGLSVGAGEWWVNLRPSNTEPLLRLNVEGDDEATMVRWRDRVLDLIGVGAAGEAKGV